MDSPRRPVGLVCAPSAFGGAQRYLLSLLAHLDAVLLPLLPLDPALAAGARGRPVVPVDGAGALAAAARDAGVGALHVNATDPVAQGALVRAALATGLPVTATVHMTDTYARPASPSGRGAPGRGTPEPATPGHGTPGHGTPESGTPDPGTPWAQLAGVVAPSRPIAAHLVGAHAVPPALVVHVPNGVAQRPAVARGRVRSPLRVACLARLTAQKGLDVLVDAVARLERERPGAVRVVVAGDGREREALVASSRGLPITWAGHATDVDAVLADADAYVQPSREDALPLALLEAMMTGLPAAATAVGDVAELLGGAVLLVPREDPAALAGALADLADDAELRERLAHQGRERVLAGHTDAVMAARTAAALGPAWASGAARAPGARSALPAPQPVGA